MGPPLEERRSFLVWAINGLGAVLAVILGFPIVCYLVDPRNRQGPRGDLKLADGVRLTELTAAQPIQQGAIRDVRRDAWTLHPNDVLGRVWVVLQPNQQVPSEAGQRKKLDKTVVKVFTTICPHLGCSVNRASDGTSFICPCHGATFDREGDRCNLSHNPAQRGMDELDWKVDPSDPDSNRLLVRYRNFKSSIATKVVLS
jgi:menaquinol-cytochrome c reductase iron-sulfur subunit